MIIDTLTTFSESQALTAAADSTNTLDIGPNGLATYPLYAVFVVEKAVTAATDFQILGSATQGGTYSGVVATGSIPAASLAEGAHICVPLPPNCPRFLKARFALAASGTGTVTAFLAFHPQTNREDTMRDAV